MAIRIEERFRVDAPPEAVWEFLVDPRRVVACVPGGELGALLDASTFDGKVRVQVGPLVLAYGGRVRLAEVDAEGRRVKIVGGARARDGSDSARLVLESWLVPLPGGGTEVVALARVDVSGRVVALGRGVLEPLAHLVFQEFAASVRARLEAERARAAAGTAAPPPGGRAEPLHAVPLVLRALRAWLAGLLRLRRERARRA
jgi:carbon monoxide dehydrogenase subunit G